MNARAFLTMLVIAAVNTVAILSFPSDERFTPNTLYVASADSGTIFAIDLADLPGPVTGLPLPPGTPDAGSLPEAITGLALPEDLAFGPDALLYITDRTDDVVRGFDADGLEITSLGGVGSAIDDPTGILFGPRGGLFVSSFGTDRVLHFAADGELANEFGESSVLDGPAGMAIGPGGKLFVASHETDEVLVFDRFDVLVDSFGVGDDLDGPWGIAFGRDGRLYVASSLQNRVKVFDTAGVLSDEFGDDVLLDGPADLAFGPDGKLYVTSTGNDMLVRFMADGTGHIMIDPSRGLTQPRGLAFAPFYMETSLSGTLAEPGVKLGRARERHVLMGLAPGSGVISLFAEDDEEDSMLRSVFGTPVMVFHGFEDFEDDRSSKRSFHGTSLTGNARGDGIGTIILETRGKVPRLEKHKNNEPAPNPPFPDALTLQSAGGQLHLASDKGVLDVSVRARYRKPKN